MQFVLLFMVSLVVNLLSALSWGGSGPFQLQVRIFPGFPFQAALATHNVASVALGIGATIGHLRGAAGASSGAELSNRSKNTSDGCA